MPIPLLIIAGAAGATGAGAVVHGITQMFGKNKEVHKAAERHQQNLDRFNRQNSETLATMDKLGEKEMWILQSFGRFSRVMEKIHNKPEFEPYKQGEVSIPKYNPEELRKVAFGADMLIGALGGAALGTAGGFAAAGATTAAVMALGTASTGTAIASLSGVALTNATLAALGGGAIAAGGGGIALGTTVLGAATLGVGLLIGGIVFSLAGKTISKKADEAIRQMREAEKEINRICEYLKGLNRIATDFLDMLCKVNNIYIKHMDQLAHIVLLYGKTDWSLFTDAEKMLTENTALLVGLLYRMCQVQLVLKASDTDELNTPNSQEVYKVIHECDDFLKGTGLGDLA